MTEPPYRADVVYQGVRGAFSEEAARRLVGKTSVELLGLPSLDAVRQALQRGLARRAVVPVRNSIAGDVPGAGALIRLSGTCIEAELTLPIVQCLVAPPRATLPNLQQVVSHPMAVAQCRHYLGARPWLRIQPHDDTAGAVQMLIESRMNNAAAIASERAAHVWGGIVLQRGIQDTDDNCTTFVLIKSISRSRFTPTDRSGYSPAR